MSAAAPDEVRDGAAAFPWAEAMAIGLGRLGLSPASFWAASPRELAAAMAPFEAHAVAPATRSVLADLMRRYPDEWSEQDAGR